MQELLMLKGASIENKMTAISNTKIEDFLSISETVKESLLKMTKNTNIIKLHEKFNNNLPKKNKENKKNKI